MKSEIGIWHVYVKRRHVWHRSPEMYQEVVRTFAIEACRTQTGLHFLLIRCNRRRASGHERPRRDCKSVGGEGSCEREEDQRGRE
jgi:hypothetical protein